MKLQQKELSPPATPPIKHKSVSSSFQLRALETNCFEHDRLVSSFQLLSPTQKQYFLFDIVRVCDNSQISFLNTLIAPRLKVDFLKQLPAELSLQILSYIDSPRTLTRTATVSKHWNFFEKDEKLWKKLCQIYNYDMDQSFHSYRSHFKHRYNINNAWIKGGKVTTVEGGFSQGLVTSMQFDEKYIVVGCDNHRIEVFDTKTGNKITTLEGHEGGVWTLQFKGGEHGDEHILVSGGCDRDVRVWALNRGKLLHTLRGHTSTIRCLKMKDKQIVVTGSRDSTLRVWDIKRGVLIHVLIGHQASVRCVDICDNLCISGSYDSTARIWDIQTGECKHILAGHLSQIYTIVTNGTIVATGSMNAHIRIWSVDTGECLAVLNGHTSLVGQLQLTGDTLFSGGADGCLRVWDIKSSNFDCLHQFSAHDNSITCLQFNQHYIVSAANDGNVKLWDIKNGRLIRQFTNPSKIVWKVQFNDTKAVVLIQRQSQNSDRCKTVMEIHDFDVVK
ncbi:WD40 repeat-like protein [Backusella circina FSU 941]|nr:WD40 repeat-like protein [Backusella circina FSU 941]